MILPLKNTPGIYLVGFMGCGKSTVGRSLAAALGWPFQDLDAVIETREQTTISQLFAEHGEAEFRRRESAALRQAMAQVPQGRPLVLALGGGAYGVEENRQTLAGHGVSLWIDCPLERCRERVAKERHRPLARDPEAFAKLYEARRPLYALADFRIDADTDDDSETVRRILPLLL
ncbi:MAG: shikimate kinase [Bryobacteraceae bacterium]|nr:shikimate kinase [Bryobacteraceae bacterium]